MFSDSKTSDNFRSSSGKYIMMRLLMLWGTILMVHAQVPPRDVTYPTFRVASIMAPPFLQRKGDDSAQLGGNEEYEGFIKDLLDELGRMMGFQYQIVLSEDNRYGVPIGDGRWNGLVGMVQDNKADFVAADLTVTSQRHDALDFSRPFMTAPITIVTKKSSSLFGGGMFDFFMPFTLDLWLLLGVAYIITALILFLIARISPYEQWAKVYHVFNLPNSFWFTFSCFFRGSNYTPKTVSTRLLTAGWYLFGISILVVYAIGLNGFIRAEFAGTQFLVPSIEALLGDSSFQIGVIQGGSTETMLQNSGIPIHQEIYERVVEDPENNQVGSYVEGIQKVLEGEGNFGLIMEGNAADYFKGQNCDLYSVGALSNKQYAFGFPIGSRYRAPLSTGLLRLRESGRLQQLMSKWWASAGNCVRDSAKQVEGSGVCKEVAIPLNLGNMAWAFIILAIFLLVSLIVAIVELILYVKKHPTTEKLGARITRHLKYAFCGCCLKTATNPMHPPYPISQSSQT